MCRGEGEYTCYMIQVVRDSVYDRCRCFYVVTSSYRMYVRERQRQDGILREIPGSVNVPKDKETYQVFQPA